MRNYTDQDNGKDLTDLFFYKKLFDDKKIELDKQLKTLTFVYVKLLNELKK